MCVMSLCFTIPYAIKCIAKLGIRMKAIRKCLPARNESSLAVKNFGSNYWTLYSTPVNISNFLSPPPHAFFRIVSVYCIRVSAVWYLVHVSRNPCCMSPLLKHYVCVFVFVYVYSDEVWNEKYWLKYYLKSGIWLTTKALLVKLHELQQNF
jgi:hypothetical protein